MGYFFKVVLVFVVLNTQIEGRYERHNQFCGGMNGSDIKWSLDVKKNKTYTLEITKRKNEKDKMNAAPGVAGIFRLRRQRLSNSISLLLPRNDVLKREGTVLPD